ncbi:ZN112-like protein [Mya arenaria]|uniref:ZN112-like protein n=1 Tax=Mya arenaria TaxID=6604 RepID=A0ABY7G9V4_MYAAR|nr:ZN112-like protein [Mya arenaria]
MTSLYVTGCHLGPPIRRLGPRALFLDGGSHGDYVLTSDRHDVTLRHRLSPGPSHTVNVGTSFPAFEHFRVDVEGWDRAHYVPRWCRKNEAESPTEAELNGVITEQVRLHMIGNIQRWKAVLLFSENIPEMPIEICITYARHVPYYHWDEEKQYKCDLCSASFGLKGHLQRHKKKVHTGDNSYKCDTCNAAFWRKNGLQSHLRIHTPEKQYICEFCSATFSWKGDLRDHMKIHPRSKPYKCGKCFADFVQSSSLQRHLRKHTEDKTEVKLYKCELCGAAFTLEQYLSSCRSKTGSTQEERQTCETFGTTCTSLPYKCESTCETFRTTCTPKPTKCESTCEIFETTCTLKPTKCESTCETFGLTCTPLEIKSEPTCEPFGTSCSSLATKCESTREPFRTFCSPLATKCESTCETLGTSSSPLATKCESTCETFGTSS